MERTRQSKREAQRGDSKDTTEKETYRESYPTMGAQYKGLPKIHSVGYRVCVYRDEVSSCLRVGEMRRGRGSAVVREQRNKNRRREKNTTIEIRSNSDGRLWKVVQCRISIHRSAQTMTEPEYRQDITTSDGKRWNQRGLR